MAPPFSPLHLSVGTIPCLKSVRPYDIFHECPFGIPWQAYNGHFDAVHVLMNYVVNVDITDDRGEFLEVQLSWLQVII